MKVAIVVQRYSGEAGEVIGGAEAHAKQIAEKLAHHLKWTVEVFTTTATDYRTWQPDFPEGSSTVSGITVHRFSPDHTRDRLRFGVWNKSLQLVEKLGWFEKVPLRDQLESGWLRAQGPYVPKLLAALRRRIDEFDQVIFFSYLYYPTVAGCQIAPEKTVLIPTAHDELPLQFRKIHNMFRNVRRIFVNTDQELNLIENTVGFFDQDRAQVVGLGFDIPPASGSKVWNAHEDYLLYMGRISKGKGIQELVTDFLNYLPQDQDLKLVLAGKEESDLRLPDDSRIVLTGVVSEEQKQRLLQRCFSVVNPSKHESLSMAVIEGLAIGKPCLVNTSSAVLQGYANELRSVYGYQDTREFGQTLREMRQKALSKPDQWIAETEESQNWVRKRWSWDRVLECYRQLEAGKKG